MKERRGKVDFSQTPSPRTSLADKLRGRGLVPAAPAEGSSTQGPAAETGEINKSHKSDKGAIAPKAAKPTKPARADIDGGPVHPAGLLTPCAKVVLRMERKRHGGKTVTVVDAVGTLGEVSLTALAKSLAKGLGCGARVESGTVIMQGDHRERAAPLLAKEGARRIIAG